MPNLPARLSVGPLSIAIGDFGATGSQPGPQSSTAPSPSNQPQPHETHEAVVNSGQKSLLPVIDAGKKTISAAGILVSVECRWDGAIKRWARNGGRRG
jgi:hypothetical protein